MNETELLAALYAAREVADEHWLAMRRSWTPDDPASDAHYDRIDKMHMHIHGAIRALVGGRA